MGPNGKDVLNVAKSLRSDGGRGPAVVGDGNNGGAGAWQAACGAPLARLRFLPGYRTPEQIEAQEARHPNQVWWYGGPRFYRGRWNGGGFGPCWTQTPIGNVWNCGR